MARDCFPTKGVHAFGHVPVPLLSMTQPIFLQDVKNLTAPPSPASHGVQPESGKFQSYQFISLAEPRLGLHVC